MTLLDPPHHRHLEAPCGGCGASWEPAPDGERGHVLHHRPGCAYIAAVDAEAAKTEERENH